MIIQKSAAIALAVALISAPLARAESGAEFLLKNVGGAAESKAQGQRAEFSPYAGFKLDSPFPIQFFSAWQDQKDLPYEINAWARQVLSRDYEGAAHLWSVVEPKLSPEFRPTAETAWVYLMWKLELPQSFMDNWLALLARPDFASSRISQALMYEIEPGFEKWLVNSSLQFSPTQEAVAVALKTTMHPVILSLQAVASQRRGEAALPILAHLPLESPLKLGLAQSGALALARKGDLAGAARVLQHQLEPAVQAKRDPKLLAEHYLHIARLLYQAGALDGARTYYEKIPNGVPAYVQAREELVWTLLRQNDTQKLRGELASLSSKVFRDRFAPELPLVRSISNLKLCFYSEVEKDFRDFSESNQSWARKIDQALAAETIPAPPSKDFYAVAAEESAAKRRAETVRLTALGERSITAVVPAVGVQSHWAKLRDLSQAREQIALKDQHREYRRQWLTLKGELKEAIRKFKFVKVELLSQLRDLTKDGQYADVEGDTLTVSQAKALPAPPKQELERTAEQIAFPFDGVMWPDEMFKLRSVAQARCLKRGG